MSRWSAEKEVLMTAGIVLAAVVLVSVFNGCSATADKVLVKSVVDLAIAECVAENPGKDEPTLREICRYADELAPTVVDLIMAQQRGVMKSGAKCPSVTSVTVSKPDGG